MKKTLLGLSAAALLMSFASCKKDYTCTCDYTNSVTNTRVTTAFPINDATRSDAHDDCDSREATLRSGTAGAGSAECEIGD